MIFTLASLPPGPTQGSSAGGRECLRSTLAAEFGKFLDRFKSYNPDGYVEKPIDPKRLLSLLDELT